MIGGQPTSQLEHFRGDISPSRERQSRTLRTRPWPSQSEQRTTILEECLKAGEQKRSEQTKTQRASSTAPGQTKCVRGSRPELGAFHGPSNYYSTTITLNHLSGSNFINNHR